MDLLFTLWLLSLGVSAGVMGTLTYQWFQHRPRRVETDNTVERLRALDRNPRRVP